MKKNKRFLSLFLAVLMLFTSAFAVTAAEMVDNADTVVETENGTPEELVPMMANECNYTSVNQMMEMVLRGHAPKGVVAVHSAHTSTGKPHVHFAEGALNIDGTVHDGTAPNLTNAQKNWLQTNGWGII